MRPTLVKLDGDYLWFWCQGCKTHKRVRIGQGDGNPNREPVWTWNGVHDAPTVHPSVLSRGAETCHLFVVDGDLRFLSDCSHELAGQSVPMERPRILGTT